MKKEADDTEIPRTVSELHLCVSIDVMNTHYTCHKRSAIFNLCFSYYKETYSDGP